MDTPSTRTPTEQIAAHVAAALVDANRSKASVARLIGMPEATFARKVKGHTDFTIPELIRVASVLHVDPAELLPANLNPSTRAQRPAA